MIRQDPPRDDDDDDPIDDLKVTQLIQESYTGHRPKRFKKREDELEASSIGSNAILGSKLISSAIEQKMVRKIEKIQEEEVDFREKPRPGVGVDREVEVICDIIKFMLNEHSPEQKTVYANEYKTVEKWELSEIIKQVSDTNLGDFIIKLPNPDSVPPESEDQYGKEEDKPLKMNGSQAMDLFYDLFDIETASKVDSQRENVAYLVSFYLLKFDSKLEERDEVTSAFIKIYNYYRLVKAKTITEYLAMRQDEGFIQQHESEISRNFRDIFVRIECFREGKSIGKLDELYWRKLKATIYDNMREHLLNELQREFGRDNDKPAEGDEESFGILMGKIRSCSELFREFPEVLERLIRYMQENCEEEERQLFKGQYLRKTVTGDNIIWINSKSRPGDITTLLRFSLLYKLVVKSKLFVRMFMSKDENYLMLVVKTSEQIMENYAQKYKIKMEVELGATDVFSFEPVDTYFRPLRLNDYIRDLQFKQKYSIKPGGSLSQQDEDKLKSIESEGLNLYKKAETMNDDQLRTKIILDQFETDKLYEWTSNKLNIDYIKNKPLTNDYNTEAPSRRTWELYYVYNKMIIAFLKRVQNLYKVDKKAKEYHAELEGNVGLILRLMFQKAICACNEMYYNHREVRGVCPRVVTNVCTTEEKLKSIWTYMNIRSPSGFATYRRTKTNQKMWRKFEVNELKDRSKFFPAQRLMITNKVLYDGVNLSKGLQKKHIIDYYPLHDPYVLKNIDIEPYIMNIKKLGPKEKPAYQGPSAATVNKLYSMYESEATEADFTKSSIQKKLGFKCSELKQFNVDAVRYYCGEKLAFYFEFVKFLAQKAFPFLLPSFIIQIILWAEQGDITQTGSSDLTDFCNFLIFCFTFVNLFWTTNLIETWKANEKLVAQKYGTSSLEDFQEKRVKFEGSFKRDFETDELNFEYVPAWKTALKTFFTLVVNAAYVILVALVILLLFVFKTYLYQRGLPQQAVNIIPSVLISIASQIFSTIYSVLIRNITIFENHKTVSEYESSLNSKVFLMTFFINFYSIFIFAFFSNYLGSNQICELRTTQTNERIQNCDYYVSTQLLSFVLVDLVVTIIGGVLPFVMIKVKEWFAARETKKGCKFNTSFFESIDRFYQQQDGMDSYMYNEELDQSWLSFMKIINVFAATALFAPVLPLTYTMMFVTGIARLHFSKYEIIFFKKRTLPIKTKSINSWLTIIEGISYLSIITNIAYMIYTRQVFKDNQARLFFLFIILFFACKYYLLSQYSEVDDMMAKRNEIKTTNVLLGRRRDKLNSIPEEVNTEIENVVYDDMRLDRRFHALKGANIKAD